MITDNREDYDVNGTKLRKTVKEGNEEQLVEDYVGSIEYRNDILEAIYYSEGRKVYKDNSTSSEYQYFLKDHLGNNRVVFKDAGNGTAEKVQENHYYPFGMNMGGEWSQTSSTLANNYLYNGKELDEDFGLNWYHYGARMYDPVIGRFTGVDPLADHPNLASWSPYHYTYNSPIKYTDPDGRCPDCPDEIYVRLADHVYGTNVGDVTSNGWEAISVTNNDSGLQGALYKGTADSGFEGEYIYATAGTQDLGKDGVADVKQVLGTSKQYSESVAIAEGLSEEYTGVSFTGIFANCYQKAKQETCC